MRVLRTAVRFGVLALVALTTAACSSDSTATDTADVTDTATVTDAAADATTDAGMPADVRVPSSDTYLEPGPYAVQRTTVTFVDETRATPPSAGYAGADTRSFLTDIWLPVAAEDGPSPTPPFALVLYCHGFMSRRVDNEGLLEHLATRGFLVAAMDFPLTGTLAPGEPTVEDVVNQPADVSFILDQIVALSADPESDLYGALDVSRIGLLGVSLGSMTALLTTFHEDFRDDRVAAVALMAAPGCYLPLGLLTGSGIPLLLEHGDMDAIVPYAPNTPRLYAEASPPKVLARIHGGTHTGFADVAADFIAGLTHADSIGCSAVDNNASIGELPRISEELGGRDRETVEAECPAPCSDWDENAQALSAPLQVRVMSLAVTSFFEAFLTESEDARTYLRYGLGRQNPVLSVTSEL